MFLLGLGYLRSGAAAYPIFNEQMMEVICCFYGGVLVQEVHNRYNKQMQPKWMLECIILLIFSYASLQFFSHPLWETNHTGSILVYIFILPLIIIVSLTVPYIRKILCIPPLQYLGSISLDLYMWHVPVQVVFKIIESLTNWKINYGSISIWLFYSCLVIAVSCISHRLQPIIRHHYFSKTLITITLSDIAMITVKRRKSG